MFLKALNSVLEGKEKVNHFTAGSKGQATTAASDIIMCHI